MNNKSIVSAAIASAKSAAKKAPGASISKKAKSSAVKEAQEGKDMGSNGKNFSKIATSAGKKYGSAAAGKKVAGAVFWGKVKNRTA